MNWMSLRELKKEIHSLANIEKNLKDFQDNWIKPLRTNTNSHLPFLKKLDPDTRLQLNKKLVQLQDDINQIKQSQMINERLIHHSRYLIEMKLNSLQGNQTKSQVITDRLLNDDVFNIKQTISDVQSFETSLNNLQEQYEEINELVQKRLSLEETLFFMDLPHKIYLGNLIKISQEQKNIVRNLGRNFVHLAKQANLRKVPHK